MSELKELQQPAQKLLRELGIRYSSKPRTTGRNYDTNKDLTGHPDLIIHIPKPFAVEFKQNKNKLSIEQEKWLEDLHNIGYDVMVITDFEIFRKELQKRIII